MLFKHNLSSYFHCTGVTDVGGLIISLRLLQEVLAGGACMSSGCHAY